MERKVFEDQLYALEERFKAWDKDMHSLLANALGDDKEITLVALDAQDNLPVVTVCDTWNDTTSNVEIKKVLLWESGTVMFQDVDGGIRSEDSISTSQGIYPLLAAVRDELKAREGIKI
jgi:hypothetical protein